MNNQNKDLEEALNRESAIREILHVISRSKFDLQPVLERLAENATELCSASLGLVYRIDGENLRLAAHYGIPDELINWYSAGGRGAELNPGLESMTGRAAVMRRAVQIADVPADQQQELLDVPKPGGYRAGLGVPMIRDDKLIGVFTLFCNDPKPFTDGQVELLTTFAEQAVIAIEQVRLFQELESRNQEITDAQEQQTATSAILHVISTSPTDIQPVFDRIAENAARLCEGQFGTVFRYDGELIHMVGHHGLTTKAVETWGGIFPRPVGKDTVIGRAILNRETAHIADVESMGSYQIFNIAHTVGFRSLIGVPMLHKDRPLGGVVVARQAVGEFPASQVDLLKTFAAQAVIAIENVRLFQEVETRTQALTESVERLTALGEIGQAVNSSLDTDEVLDTIVRRAVDLTGAQSGVIYEFDEALQIFEARSTHRITQEHLNRLRETPIRLGEGAIGRAGETYEPVAVADIQARGEPVAPQVLEQLLKDNLHSLLAVPLLREQRLLGGLVIMRRQPGEFSSDVVALLTTFASQSAVAIQNARLFREIEQKSRQLELASRHKSQFLANMSHELRTPLNAILGYTELICDEIYGPIPDEIREVMVRVEHNGHHLLELINSVLDISKIEAGHLVLNIDAYSIRDLVYEAIAAVEPLAAGKGLAIGLEVADTLPEGRADAARLRQVLLNLLGNSIKFTESGGLKVEVSVHKHDFEVTVTDTGPGISLEDQERIFDEFQQVDDSNTREKGGTGLGLAISRRILHLHGGEIEVESAPGQGATFRFHLPIICSLEAA